MGLSSHRFGSSCAAALAAAIATTPLVARAQQPVRGNFALDRYDPPPAGDAFPGVPAGEVQGTATAAAGVWLDYAHRPLIFRSADGDVAGGAVSGQWWAHLGASLALWDRCLLSLTVPFALVNDGEDPSDGGSVAESPSGPAFGDLRLGARLQLVDIGPAGQLALGTYLWFPTGDPSAYAGDAGMRSMPHLSFGGAWRAWSYGAFAGVQVRERVEVLGVAVGPALAYGVAAGVQLLPRRLVVGPEVVAATTFSPSEGQEATGLEARAFARVLLGPVSLGAAGGPGLTRAAGTPAFRALATVQYQLGLAGRSIGGRTEARAASPPSRGSAPPAD